MWLVVLLVGAGAFAQVTIEFSGWPTDERMAPILERFHEENPDIKVELTLEGPPKVLTRIAGGVPPTVFRVSWAELADFAETGTVIDLQPYIDRDRQDLDLQDLWPPTLASGRYQGVQYGMPMNVGGQLLFVNQDHLNTAGIALDPQNWTYDDFVDIAQRTSRDINGDGAADIWGYADVNNWGFWTGLIYSNGGTLLNAEYTAAEADSPQVVQAIRFIDDLVNRRGAATGPGVTKPSFQSGQATFWLTSAPSVFRLGEPGFKWTVVPNPKGTQRRVMMGGNQPLLISKDATPEEREAAWKLIKLIARSDTQAWFGNMGWNAPSRKSAIPHVEHELIRVYAREVENQVQYTNRMHGDINRTFNQHLNAVLSGELSPENASLQIDHDLDVLLSR